MAPFIENLLLNSSAETITNLFLWGLMGVLLVALGLKKANRGHQFTQYTPTLLTTLGILGTFVGIVSGLLGFDVNDIDGSIGNLLSGLKTAFITSLAGMLFSIFFKLLMATGLFSPRQKGEIDEDEIGIVELYGVMKEQAEGIQSLHSAIGGEGDASLVSQLKSMRTDLNDNHKGTLKTLEPAAASLAQLQELAGQQQQEFTQFQERLWRNLQDFADMLSKSATEQVINALKEVIADFNNNLIEQFGENFKQLNAAVLELVQWQENYKLQLEQMMAQYQLGVQAITQTETAVSHISEESKVIPASMQELKGVMEVNQHQLAELERHLEAFKDIRDRAVEAVPEIRAQIDETVNGMKAATETMTMGIQESATSLQQAITNSGEDLVTNSERVNASLQGSSDVIAKNSEETRQMFEDGLRETNSILRVLVADLKDDSTKLTESYKEASQSLVTETDAMRSRFEQGIDAMRKELGEQLHQIVETQAQENARVLKGMSQHADQALSDTGEAVQKQVKMLDDALARELNQVMNEMGRALATISGKFTADYQQLVNEMHQVVQYRGERRA